MGAVEWVQMQTAGAMPRAAAGPGVRVSEAQPGSVTHTMSLEQMRPRGPCRCWSEDDHVELHDESTYSTTAFLLGSFSRTV